MGKVSFNEFIPPIFTRVYNYLIRKFGKFYKSNVRTSPFNYLPEDMKVKWVLDIGANVGDIAVSALNSFSEAKVICFEPVQSTFEILSNRLAPYSERVYLHNYALSNSTGQGEINITNFHGANSIMPQAKLHQDYNPHVRELNKEPISLVRLDDVSNKFPARNIDIMKIDVEGFELNVLNGGRKFITKHVDVIIIEISLMRDVKLEKQSVFDIFAFMKDAGFCLVNVFDVHNAESKPIMLAQMDCVFRHTRKLNNL
ncbi:FkbM family methyltransferase [Alphaproteobacteria bacterium]|nr:FkbM family methyltransferase [Alphaproteobacteria bacterium]